MFLQVEGELEVKVAAVDAGAVGAVEVGEALQATSSKATGEATATEARAAALPFFNPNPTTCILHQPRRFRLCLLFAGFARDSIDTLLPLAFQFFNCFFLYPGIAHQGVSRVPTPSNSDICSDSCDRFITAHVLRIVC